MSCILFINAIHKYILYNFLSRNSLEGIFPARPLFLPTVHCGSFFFVLIRTIRGLITPPGFTVYILIAAKNAKEREEKTFILVFLVGALYWRALVPWWAIFRVFRVFRGQQQIKGQAN